jgi:inorganic pyrophosphatase
VLNYVTAGDKAPDQINVVIEIPAHSEPVKYEVDKASGAMFVDRFMSSSMRYPCDYGYIPQTLGNDGDPIDVIVISPLPLISGSVITVRPVGMLNMTDESGEDTKILAVPIDKLTPIYQHIHAPRDLGQFVLDRIAHFFQHYKDLEPNKWVKIEGWQDTTAAKNEINAGLQRYIDNKTES